MSSTTGLPKHLPWNQGQHPVSSAIIAETMQMAITFTDTLETTKGISEVKSPAGLKVGVLCEDIQKRILCLPGPFVSVRRVVRSYSSTRPNSKAAQEAMAVLQAARIGSVMKINKLVVFFKKLPIVANSHAVAACGVTPEEYHQAFLTKDKKITEDMLETVMNAHPQKDEIAAFLEATE